MTLEKAHEEKLLKIATQKAKKEEIK